MQQAECVDVPPPFFTQPSQPARCAACRSADGTTLSRGVCGGCLAKIARYNAMVELVDEAMIGAERVAVPVPEGDPRVPGVPDVISRHLMPRFAALWSAFPKFEGSLVDVDHLPLSEAIPPSNLAEDYVSSLPDASPRCHRLVPKHLAVPLAQLEYNLYELAAAAYAQGVYEHEQRAVLK